MQRCSNSAAVSSQSVKEYQPWGDHFHPGAHLTVSSHSKLLLSSVRTCNTNPLASATSFYDKLKLWEVEANRTRDIFIAQPPASSQLQGLTTAIYLSASGVPSHPDTGKINIIKWRIHKCEVITVERFSQEIISSVHKLQHSSEHVTSTYCRAWTKSRAKSCIDSSGNRVSCKRC